MARKRGLHRNFLVPKMWVFFGIAVVTVICSYFFYPTTMSTIDIKDNSNGGVKLLVDHEDFLKFVEGIGASEREPVQKLYAAEAYGRGEGQVDYAVADTNEVTTRDFSRTNVQVAGVDEGDIVKTDGAFIYTGTANGNFFVIEINGMKISCSVKLKGEVKAILLSKEVYEKGRQRVAVVTSRIEEKRNFQLYSIIPYASSVNYVDVNIIDISSGSEGCTAKVSNVISLSGEYKGSRKFPNGKVVVQSNTRLWGSEDPSLIAGHWLNGMVGKAKKVFYFPDINYGRYSTIYTSLLSFSFDNDNDVSSAGILLDGHDTVLYASLSSIYVTISKGYSPSDTRSFFFDVLVPMLPEKYRKQIGVDYDWNRISGVLGLLHDEYGADKSNEILNNAYAVAETKGLFSSKMQIHKFIFGDGSISHVKSSGDLAGTPLNQFALDEYAGRLRVAVTVRPNYVPGRAFRKPFNSIYVLNAEDLIVKGSLERIAVDESIYSARFMGPKLYLVTFKQTDPLFTIDMSGDTPELLGELKVPGFSNYLHPVGDMLLGVGKEERSVKVELFDVSDMTAPSRLDRKLISDRNRNLDTPVASDHHSFLFIEKLKQFAFPVESRTGRNYWSRMYVYEIKGKKLVEKGSFELGKLFEWQILNKGNNQEYDRIRRMIYVEDKFYLVSERMILKYNMDSLALEGKIELFGK